MMEERCPPLFDIEPVEHANPDELEAERIAAMLGFARERYPNVFARLSNETALMQLGVLTRVDGRICPTLGGLVAGSIFRRSIFRGSCSRCRSSRDRGATARTRAAECSS